jgi:serpin B
VTDAESRHPLPGAIVTAGNRSAQTDSLGRFSLEAVPVGEARVRILRIGFFRIDTTIVVVASSPARLDASLRPAFPQRDIVAAEAKNVAAGRTDSSAFGLLHLAPLDSPLTFKDFGARFVRELARSRPADSNTVLSPVSVAFALSIPLLGARGATAREISTTLGVQDMDSAVRQRRTAAAMTLGNGRRDVELSIANALWVDTLVRLVPSFGDAIAVYHASIHALPLRAPSTVDAINAWADSATHGKITKILKEPLANTTRLFIANAVYFKAKWLDQFEKSETHPRDFRLASGQVVQVDAMQRTGYIGYRRGDGYQMVRLPYRGGRFAMYLVLPDSLRPIDAVEQEFAQHGWPPSLHRRDFREVHHVIPRLHVADSYDLAPALKSLGILRAFNCNLADFSGIAVDNDRGSSMPLCIGKARQTVYLDVDEEGTEAAAVTGVSVVATSLGPPPIQFIIDRPFLLAIRDELTGADLFAGVIARP